MLLKPENFAQRWRAWMILLIAGAGVIATTLATGIVLIIWLGNWSEAVETARITLLARVAIGALCLMGMSMIGLLIAGPLSKISGKYSSGSGEFSLEGDEEA